MSGVRAVVGIDLGTSQLKALVASLYGQVFGRGRAAYQVAVPADAAEAAAEGELEGASRGRSGYGKGEVVAPGERIAASAGYDRFLFFRRSWPTR